MTHPHGRRLEEVGALLAIHDALEPVEAVCGAYGVTLVEVIRMGRRET